MDPVSDLEFFVGLVKHGSLTALARELGVTPPAVSKKLFALEKRLGVRLLTRTTRRIALTQEGESYLGTGVRLLEQIQELERSVSSSRDVPQGLLKVNATFGFGRRYIVPAICAFHRQYRDVEVQLELTDRPMNLSETAFDVGVRFGTLPDQRMVARLLVPNQRFVCASADYLARAGTPKLPSDLRQHACLVLRENDSGYGTWQFSKGKRLESVKVHGILSSNDGEATLSWALAGEGILVRSAWDVQPFINAGKLTRLLSDWRLPDADIYAIFPQRLHLSAKVRVFIDFLQAHLGGLVVDAQRPEP
jgi:DNA-binding transcriptional LysR family regulator